MSEDTAWFERLYAAAEAGEAKVPWNRGGPNPFLAQWVRERGLAGAGRRALVIGTALGDDAELLASRGFAVTAFDIAPTAIEAARRRFPSSSVDYRVADLLALPEAWRGAFDLVAEAITVQALPLSLRDRAIDAIASTVAVGGTLVVLSGIHDGDGHRDGPPWPLTQAELDRFERSLRPVEEGSSTTRRTAAAISSGVAVSGSSTTAAPSSATRAAVTGWSAPIGSSTDGSPCARVPSAIPEPPEVAGPALKTVPSVR